MPTPKRIASRRREPPPARSKRSPLPDSGKQKERVGESLIASAAVAKLATADSESSQKIPQLAVLSDPRQLIDEARRILACADTLPSLELQDDDVKIIAGMHALRRLAEEATEMLILFLDELEPDPDLEPSTSITAPGLLSGALDECEPEEDEEPSLGWTERAQHGDTTDRELTDGDEEPSLASINPDSTIDQRDWSIGADNDAEAEHDGREPEEVEPSLGFLEQVVDQTHIALGAPNHDLEGEHDGREPDEADEEPSLGWTDMESRYDRYATGCNFLTDAEQEHDGREPDADAEEDDPSEPSLGSIEVGEVRNLVSNDSEHLSEVKAVGIDQSAWGRTGNDDDLEGDCSDCEPDSDNGIGDEGGMQEQFAGSGVWHVAV